MNTLFHFPSQQSLRFSKVAGLVVLAISLVTSISLTGCSVTTENKSPNSYVNRLSQSPVIDRKISEDDFDFPSAPPSLSKGKAIYEKQCLSCHTSSFWQEPRVQKDLAYTTPIDMYLLLSTGKAPTVTNPSPERLSKMPPSHRSFKKELTRDERWAALFYTRYLAGEADYSYKSLEGKDLSIASIFGANCAVCHGKRGFADGPLHSGHPSSHELAAGKVHGGLFQPAPANFHDYKRLYNRTDMQLVKYIKEGIYPSGMPPWYGLKDKDQKFVFDDLMMWRLAKHVRQFAFENDLSEEEIANPPKSSYPGPVGMAQATQKPSVSAASGHME